MQILLLCLCSSPYHAARPMDCKQTLVRICQKASGYSVALTGVWAVLVSCSLLLHNWSVLRVLLEILAVHVRESGFIPHSLHSIKRLRDAVIVLFELLFTGCNSINCWVLDVVTVLSFQKNAARVHITHVGPVA